MLVLSQQRGQEIVLRHVGNPTELIVVKVVDIRGDKVRLGIEAPKHFLVDRIEVYRDKQRSSTDGGLTKRLMAKRGGHV